MKNIFSRIRQIALFESRPWGHLGEIHSNFWARMKLRMQMWTEKGGQKKQTGKTDLTIFSTKNPKRKIKLIKLWFYLAINAWDPLPTDCGPFPSEYWKRWFSTSLFFPVYKLPSCLHNDTGPFLQPRTQVMKYHWCLSLRS